MSKRLLIWNKFRNSSKKIKFDEKIPIEVNVDESDIEWG